MQRYKRTLNRFVEKLVWLPCRVKKAYELYASKARTTDRGKFMIFIAYLCPRYTENNTVEILNDTELGRRENNEV